MKGGSTEEKQTGKTSTLWSRCQSSNPVLVLKRQMDRLATLLLVELSGGLHEPSFIH